MTGPGPRLGGRAAMDHTSFAVHDAGAWARRLRRELGATPIAGEVLPEFRYLLLHVGTAEEGGRLELLEPTGPGFLTRYLAARGEGPHHLTFTVPDLPAAVARVRDAGLTVVGEDLDHPPWREAFIAPDRTHGVVVQLAQSDRAYPPPAELLRTRERDPAGYPSTRGAEQPLWWTPVWDTPQGAVARLAATRLASRDLDVSRRLFEDVLGGTAEVRSADEISFSWPGGRVTVSAAETAGISGVDLLGGPDEPVWIGSAVLRRLG